jgi:predicted metal-dependent hydrolase
MAFMDPSSLPPDRAHLEPDDRHSLLRFDLLVADRRFDEAQEAVEDLWFEATDAHRDLYHGLANALTAVCAREVRQLRGSREIAARSRVILDPFPRRVLGIDLDAFLDSVDAFVIRGEGPILLLRQG